MTISLARKLRVLCLVVATLSVAPTVAGAFDVTGGTVWANRVGPGLGFGLGLNFCTRDYCDDVWDTSASIGGTVDFHWRVIPNLVVYGGIHTGHLPTDITSGRVGFLFADVDNDNGFVFQATGGAEFHLPLAGWVAPFVGFGMGFIYLGTWGEIDLGNDNLDFHGRLMGLDFELKFGADFYPFFKAPTLGLGPIIRVGLPYWVKGCWEAESVNDGKEECDDVDDDPVDLDDDETPFIVFIGVGMRYGF